MGDSQAAILVIDLGLTNCKAVVFSADGEILGRASAPYTIYYPAPGYVEQDPEEWWQAAASATCSLWETDPGLASRIECVSVTGHMHALVCLDKEGKPLANALVLGDRRSAGAAAEMVAELELPAIYQITGARMDASMPAAKIRWLKENAPEIYKNTWLFTGCKDAIRHQMTGDRLTDPIDACAMSLYDIQARSWSPELTHSAGVALDDLPEVHPPTELAGSLQETPANALGLKPGMPVVVGGGDDVEVLGNGLMAPGFSLEHLGTTGSILTCAGLPIYDPEMALELYPHAEPGLWVLGGSITAAGSALAWAAETLGYDSLDDALTVLSASSPEADGSLVFLPHLLGERSPNWEPRVRGAWIGLTATHTRDDMMQAAFEGVAYALKSMLERIEALVGEQEQITVVHRSNDSNDWLGMRANIFERPLGLLRTPEPTALGAMALAAVGIGLYGDLHEAVRAVTGLERLVQPETHAQSIYRQRYSVYQGVGAALLPVWTAGSP